MNFNDYDLSGELRAKLTTDYDANISGLKAKNSDLINREATAKQNLETSKVEFEQGKHDLAKELAEKNDSMADYKAALDNEKEQMTLLKHSFQEANDSRTLSDAVTNFSSGLIDDPAGRMYMQSIFKDSVEVKDGVIVSKDTTKTLQELTQSLVTDKANAKYIKAAVGSGGGSIGSDGGFISVKSLKDMTATEEAILANEDPALYQLLLTK